MWRLEFLSWLADHALLMRVANYRLNTEGEKHLVGANFF